MSSNVPTVNSLDLPSLPLVEHHDLLDVLVYERLHA